MTMATAWSEVRAEAAGRLDEQRITNEKKLLTEAVRAHRLADVRKQQSVTQNDLGRGHEGVAGPSQQDRTRQPLTH